nr:unnamed protein product [Callosobruchus chinensis]
MALTLQKWRNMNEKPTPFRTPLNVMRKAAVKPVEVVWLSSSQKSMPSKLKHQDSAHLFLRVQRCCARKVHSSDSDAKLLYLDVSTKLSEKNRKMADIWSTGNCPQHPLQKRHGRDYPPCLRTRSSFLIKKVMRGGGNTKIAERPRERNFKNVLTTKISFGEMGCELWKIV